MARAERQLTEAERRELKQGVPREIGRTSERMRSVILSGRGYSVAEIARIFECDKATGRECKYGAQSWPKKKAHIGVTWVGT